MLPRWVRHVLAFLATLVVWAVAKPALAAAPMCDFRGATAMAPAPELEQPQSSIDAATSAEDCVSPLATASVASDGRAPEPTPPSAAGGEPAVLSVAARIVPAASAFAGLGVSSVDGERAGERGRVDRPPRF